MIESRYKPKSEHHAGMHCNPPSDQATKDLSTKTAFAKEEQNQAVDCNHNQLLNSSKVCCPGLPYRMHAEGFELKDYYGLKESDSRWVSNPRSTLAGYKYSLIVRPNGLRYAEGYGRCLGAWINPIPGDHDNELPWPAKVKMSLQVKGSYDKLVIPMQEYTWGKFDTKCHCPAFHFKLDAIEHSAIEVGYVESGKIVILIVEEFEC